MPTYQHINISKGIIKIATKEAYYIIYNITTVPLKWTNRSLK